MQENAGELKCSPRFLFFMNGPMADPSSPAAPEPARPPAPERFIEQALRLARFFTRLPLPTFAFERAPYAAPDFNRAAPALPLVGLVVGLCAGLTGLAAYLIGISTQISAILTIAVGAIVTGALHEDGLADCCDGFWGGSSPERRIEIMRDSRLGTFGVLGLVVSLLVRIFALTELFRQVGPVGLLLVPGVAALSRPLAIAPALWLEPASNSGAARAVHMPSARQAGIAMLIGFSLALLCAAPSDLVPAMAGAGLLALVGVYAFSRLAEAKIGGYTGDVFGASQQLAEIIALVLLSSAAHWHGPI